MLAVVVGAVLLTRSDYIAGLSAARLGRALAAAGDRFSDVPDIAGAAGLAFAGGLLLGWLAAWQVLRRRLRYGSLLLVDPRQPDMAFLDGVAHVRAHGLADPEEGGAAALILKAAARGQLSVWRGAASSRLRRLSSRQLRRTDPVLPDLFRRSGEDMGMLIDLVLLRAEVEKLWPSTRRLQSVASGAQLARTRKLVDHD